MTIATCVSVAVILALCPLVVAGTVRALRPRIEAELGQGPVAPALALREPDESPEALGEMYARMASPRWDTEVPEAEAVIRWSVGMSGWALVPARGGAVHVSRSLDSLAAEIARRVREVRDIRGGSRDVRGGAA